MYLSNCHPNLPKPDWVSEKINIKEHFLTLVTQREKFEERHRPIRTRPKPKNSYVESADSDKKPVPEPNNSCVEPEDADNMPGPSVRPSNTVSAEPVVAVDPKRINLGTHQPAEPESSTPRPEVQPLFGRKRKPSARTLKSLELYTDFPDPKLGLGLGHDLGSDQPPEPESRPRPRRPMPKPKVQPFLWPKRRNCIPKPTAKSLKALDLYADFRFTGKHVMSKVNYVALGQIARNVNVGPAVSMALPVKLMKDLPENSDLKTIIFAKTPAGQKKIKKKKPRIARVVYQDNGRFDKNAKADLIPGRTLVVVVRVYWPNQPRPEWRRRRVKPILSQVIVMLGSQTLDHLRDKIRCNADAFTPEECSKLRDNMPSHTNKDVYKSGFLFINDTFYNDYRGPKNIDYSEVIREWADKKKLGPFESCIMESTKMEDLTVQLGKAYVYQHQGYCEHLFTIMDIRLLTHSEPRSLAAYPYVLYEAMPKAQKCYMCGTKPAYWLTKNDSRRLPYSPVYFCDKCHDSFNYVDGKPAADFLAYRSNGPIYKRAYT